MAWGEAAAAGTEQVTQIGGQVLGAWFSKKSAEKQNKANRDAAQKQMDFQERMSSSAHQREQADLKAAGLNPMLAAMKGGSSSPGGASAQAVSEMEGFAQAARETPGELLQNRLLRAQVKSVHSATSLTSAQAALTRAGVPKKAVESEIYENVLKAINLGKSTAKDWTDSFPDSWTGKNFDFKKHKK